MCEVLNRRSFLFAVGYLPGSYIQYDYFLKKGKFAEPGNYLKDQQKSFVSKIVLQLIEKKKFSLQPFFFLFPLLRTQRQYGFTEV